MHRFMRWVAVAAVAALPVAAASAQTDPDLVQAQQVLVLAEGAGAQTYAKSLYDDAAYRIRFAQENLNSPKVPMQEQARMRAREALFAGRAALAKARWLSINAAVRNLQGDIVRFGGRSDLRLQDEDPNIDFRRGTTTKEKIAAAQSAIDQARAAGAEQTVPDNELNTAQSTLGSARKVSRDGRDNSDVADYLAYTSEMTARRAYYMARFTESSRYVPDLQLQRTRLAQASSEQQAAADRAQREEAERRTAALQQQLAAEAANRQAQAAEVDRLRQQVADSRRALQQRVDADRTARVDAERSLDEAMRQYEAAVAAGNSADIDRLRRQAEDREIALRAIQEHERLDAEAMASDIATMRNEPNMNSDLIAQRQAQLEQYRAELQADVAARADIEHHHEQAIATAQKQRSDAEARSAAMQQQLLQAQQAAAQAAEAAKTAQQQMQAMQQQMQEQQQKSQQQMQEEQQKTQQQMQAIQQQAQQTQQQLAQQAQQSQAEAEKARQAAQAAQAELEKTREELARRDAEARQLRMQQELARIAATKAEPRGIVVTLPGIFFDPGKTQLKAGAKATLKKIAAQIKSSDTAKVSVEGHTDNVGSPAKNEALSQKRAEAVRDYLVSQGVPSDRISAIGKGEAEPIATNKTVAGRQQNRRVELVITM